MTISRLFVVVSFVVFALPPAPAGAWPGEDAVAELEGCTTTVRNADMQEACKQCLAKKGQHYHFAAPGGTSREELVKLTPMSCHRVNAPLPPPPATITEELCDRYSLGKKLDACKSCIDSGGWYKPKAGKCEDPDPATLKGAARLDGVDCSTMPQLADASLTRKRLEKCSTCVRTGGVFVVDAFGGQCAALELPDTMMPVADAAGCRDKSVAPLRRRRCTDCLATGFAEFQLIGNDAGQCVTNPAKYAAKFNLPEESVSTGLYTSCAGIWDAAEMLRCRSCLTKHEVFAGGACMKPKDAAKRATKLPNVPVTASVLVPNGSFEVIEERDLGRGKKGTLPMTWDTDSKHLLDATLLVDAGGARTGKLGVKLASGARLHILRRITPSTKYKLTYWVKAAMPDGAIYAQLNTERATARGPKTETAPDWTQVSHELDSFPNDTTLRVTLVADKAAPGAFFVDDVELVAIGPATSKTPPAAPAIKVEAGKNLVTNGGFESATGWSFDAVATADKTLAATKDAAHGGGAGLQFSASKRQELPRAWIDVPIEPGRKYQLVFWVKAVGVSPTNTLFASVNLGKGNRLKGPKTTDAAKDWTKQTFDFTAAATETKATLTFSSSIDVAGSFYLDDVELVALP